MSQKHLMKYYHGSIKIDLDKKKIPKIFHDRIKELNKFYKFEYPAIKNVIQLNITKSPSNKGWHIQLRPIKRITVAEALLIQIFLCSDIKREFMNFMRVLNGADLEKWNILFTKKVGVSK